jgi:hypothetical protein
MLGNPVYWGGEYQDHTKDQLAKLTSLGVDTLVLNIAWSRPWLDVVNLEELYVPREFGYLGDPDGAAAKRETLRRRMDAALAADLKPFFLFGVPKVLDPTTIADQPGADDLVGSPTSRIDPTKGVACIRSESLRRLYRDLIAQHFDAFPETDGILIYTMDELAEVCDVLDDCPRCHNVPLAHRLPEFLAFLRSCVDQHKPLAELWWEPWEFSATQTYEVVERMPARVHLALHRCIHEVYYSGTSDSWFSSLCRLARERDVKVIAELFWSGTGEDLGPLPALPCPRLVLEALADLAGHPAVVGIKEYFGTVAEHIGPNELATRAWLDDPGRPTQDILLGLSRQYGDPTSTILGAWEHASRAVEAFPWDLSWRMRQYNSIRYDQYAGDAYWNQGFASTLPTPWTTPSWQSSRLGFYVAAQHSPQPDEVRLWLETEARLERSEDSLESAEARLVGALDSVRHGMRADVERQIVSVRAFTHLVRSRRLHCQASRRAARVRHGYAPLDLLVTLRADLANARELRALVDQEELRGFDLEAMDRAIASMETDLAEAEGDGAAWATRKLL